MMKLTQNNIRRYGLEKLAEYECERLPIYSGTQVKGQIKQLSVWRTKPTAEEGRNWYMVQVGNGTLYHCHSAQDHESQSAFTFGYGKAAQRWAKI